MKSPKKFILSLLAGAALFGASTPAFAVDPADLARIIASNLDWSHEVKPGEVETLYGTLTTMRNLDRNTYNSLESHVLQMTKDFESYSSFRKFNMKFGMETLFNWFTAKNPQRRALSAEVLALSKLAHQMQLDHPESYNMGSGLFTDVDHTRIESIRYLAEHAPRWYELRETRPFKDKDSDEAVENPYDELMSGLLWGSSQKFVITEDPRLVEVFEKLSAFLGDSADMASVAQKWLKAATSGSFGRYGQSRTVENYVKGMRQACERFSIPMVGIGPDFVYMRAHQSSISNVYRWYDNVTNATDEQERTSGASPRFHEQLWRNFQKNVSAVSKWADKYGDARVGAIFARMADQSLHGTIDRFTVKLVTAFIDTEMPNLADLQLLEAFSYYRAEESIRAQSVEGKGSYDSRKLAQRQAVQQRFADEILPFLVEITSPFRPYALEFAKAYLRGRGFIDTAARSIRTSHDQMVAREVIEDAHVGLNAWFIEAMNAAKAPDNAKLVERIYADSMKIEELVQAELREYRGWDAWEVRGPLFQTVESYKAEADPTSVNPCPGLFAQAQ